MQSSLCLSTRSVAIDTHVAYQERDQLYSVVKSNLCTGQAQLKKINVNYFLKSVLVLAELLQELRHFFFSLTFTCDLNKFYICELKISPVSSWAPSERTSQQAGIMGAPGLINVTRCNNDTDKEETLINEQSIMGPIDRNNSLSPCTSTSLQDTGLPGEGVTASPQASLFIYLRGNIGTKCRSAECLFCA